MKQTNLEWLLTQNRSVVSDVFSKEFLGAPTDSYDFIRWLASPRTEPIVLTAEERNAAELAVAIGLPWIKHERVRAYDNTIIFKDCQTPESYGILDMPNVKILHKSTWITAEPLDLRELL